MAFDDDEALVLYGITARWAAALVVRPGESRLVKLGWALGLDDLCAAAADVDPAADPAAAAAALADAGVDFAPVPPRYRSTYFSHIVGGYSASSDFPVTVGAFDETRSGVDAFVTLALIAVTGPPGAETELAVARYVTNPDGRSCEFAIVVADEWQRRGIGSRLLNALMDAARQRGFREMTGEILASNHNMLELVSNLGFRVESRSEDPRIKFVSRPL